MSRLAVVHRACGKGCFGTDYGPIGNCFGHPVAHQWGGVRDHPLH